MERRYDPVVRAKRLAVVIVLLATTACDDDTQVPVDPAATATPPATTPTAQPRGNTPGTASTGTSTSPGRAPTPPPPKPLPIPVDDPPPVSVPDVENGSATSIGQTGFAANVRIQPHRQRLRWYVEYGKTEAYGSKTALETLGPRLGAYYKESWDTALGGWAGGMDGVSLVHRPSGGTSGGYVHFTAPSQSDTNHEDGIGYVQLSQYFYPGTCMDDAIKNPFLGGGDTDMRDARIAVDMRGTNFVSNGAELLFWAQSDSDLAQQNDENWRRANWAYTGFPLTEALFAGTWQHVEYSLFVDTTKWSYAGRSIGQNRPNYRYAPLEKSLAHLNCDLFHILVLRELAYQPSGSIDYDELSIVYRNHSLLARSNGGRLAAKPAGSTDGAPLTDGWRNGDGKTWQTAPNPSGPQELLFSFVRPVKITTLQIHNDPLHPSKDIEVLVSIDGMTWSSIFTGTLPATSADGPNFLHLWQRDLAEFARHMKVRILSGYQTQSWGLGEVEAFGTGAQMDTDDAWYTVSADVTGLDAATTYHYRVVTTDGVNVTYGPDATFTTASTTAPELATGPATRVTGTSAKLEGRVTPMGLGTDFWFEIGTDTTYGELTTPSFAGVEQTPRTVVGSFETLAPGTTYHYRLVASNPSGTTYGEDRTFTTK